MTPAGDWVAALWRRAWGRTLLIAITVAAVAWAVRVTAAVTGPVVDAAGAVVVPLAVGFTIAYVLTPVVDACQRRGLPRLLATAALFACFTMLLVVAMVFVVPAVLRETADLALRSVQPVVYLDRDGDGRLGRGDPRLTILPGAGGLAVHDRDGDGQRSPGEPVFAVDNPRRRTEAALLSAIGDWFERRQEEVRRWLGLDLDEGGLRRLRFAEAEVRPLLAVLDQALVAAEAGLPEAEWPAELRRTVAVPEGPVPPWPGIAGERVAAAAEALVAGAGRRWRAGVSSLVNELIQRLTAINEALARVDRGEGDESALAQRLRAELGRALADGERDRVEEFIDRLGTTAGPVAAPVKTLLAGVRLGRQAGSSYLRVALQRAGEGVTEEFERWPLVVAGWLRSLLSNLPGLALFLLDIVLVPIYAFFLTLAMPRLRESLKALLPLAGRERNLALLHAIERVVAAFFRGRLIVCLLCGLLCWLGFAALQVPYAGLFALAIGLATAIPLAGFVFLIPALLLTVVDGGEPLVVRVSLVIAVFAVVQTLEATVFTPLIMGKEVELNPVLLIIALIFFGRLFGLLGLILAVPIAATLRILVREFLLPRLRDGGLAALTGRVERRAAASADEGDLEP